MRCEPDPIRDTAMRGAFARHCSSVISLAVCTPHSSGLVNQSENTRSGAPLAIAAVAPSVRMVATSRVPSLSASVSAPVPPGSSLQLTSQPARQRAGCHGFAPRQVHRFGHTTRVQLRHVVSPRWCRISPANRQEPRNKANANAGRHRSRRWPVGSSRRKLASLLPPGNRPVACAA